MKVGQIQRGKRILLKKVYRQRISSVLFILLLLLVTGCTTDRTPNALAPQGPAAERIEFLWWIMFGLGTVVYVVVMSFLLLALFRRSRAGATTGNNKIIVIAGVVIPFFILAVVYGFTLGILRALNIPAEADEVEVIVNGHQWWWEVIYPDESVTTANELHIPAGRPVKLTLTSDDVIHSFWVPELHGKRDMVPGQVNTFWIEANDPGVYWGVCAEFCGIQHAKMLFVVVAQEPDAYAQWIAEQQEPAEIPTDADAERGYQIFFDTGCNECHAIAGTPADGDLGPDLTHFASRLTLGAGIAPNTRGHLAGWIADPHGMKPGNLMPASVVSGPELQDLLAFMETLE